MDLENRHQESVIEYFARTRREQEQKKRNIEITWIREEIKRQNEIPRQAPFTPWSEYKRAQNLYDIGWKLPPAEREKYKVERPVPPGFEYFQDRSLPNLITYPDLGTILMALHGVKPQIIFITPDELVTEATPNLTFADDQENIHGYFLKYEPRPQFPEKEYRETSDIFRYSARRLKVPITSGFVQKDLDTGEIQQFFIPKQTDSISPFVAEEYSFQDWHKTCGDLLNNDQNSEFLLRVYKNLPHLEDVLLVFLGARKHLTLLLTEQTHYRPIFFHKGLIVPTTEINLDNSKAKEYTPH